MMNKSETEFDNIASEKIDLGLLNSHIHFLTGDIDEESVEKTIKWIVYENITPSASSKVLTLYINSGGGSLNDALG